MIVPHHMSGETIDKMRQSLTKADENTKQIRKENFSEVKQLLQLQGENAGQQQFSISELSTCPDDILQQIENIQSNLQQPDGTDMVDVIIGLQQEKEQFEDTIHQLQNQHNRDQQQIDGLQQRLESESREQERVQLLIEQIMMKQEEQQQVFALKLNEMTDALATKQAQLDECLTHVNDKASSNSDLQQHVELQQIINSQQQQIAQQNQLLHLANLEKQNCQQELEVIQQKLGNAENEIEELQYQQSELIKSVVVDSPKEDSEPQKMLERVLSLNDENEELLKTLVEFEDQREQSDKHYQQKISTIMHENDALIGYIQLQDRTIQLATSKIGQLSESILALQQDNDKLLQFITANKQSDEQNNECIFLNQSELNELKSELTAIKQQFLSIKQNNCKVSELQNVLGKITSQNEYLVNENDHLQTQNRSLNQKLLEFDSNLDQLHQGFCQELETVVGENALLKQQIEQLQKLIGQNTIQSDGSEKVQIKFNKNIAEMISSIDIFFEKSVQMRNLMQKRCEVQNSLLQSASNLNQKQIETVATKSVEVQNDMEQSQKIKGDERADVLERRIDVLEALLLKQKEE